MKYKAYITYEYYDSTEIEANSFDEAMEKAQAFVDESTRYSYDHVEIEVEEDE